DRIPQRERTLDAARRNRRAAAGGHRVGAQRRWACRGRPGTAGTRDRWLRKADGWRASDRGARDVQSLRHASESARPRPYYGAPCDGYPCDRRAAALREGAAHRVVRRQRRRQEYAAWIHVATQLG